MHPRAKKLPLHHALLAITCAGLLPSHAWRPSLFPENWTPPDSASFTTYKLIQDFSYAGYRRGKEPIPNIAGPIFDTVATFGTDPTGASDSTAAIHAVIDAAAAADGGVVVLPAGTLLRNPPPRSSAPSVCSCSSAAAANLSVAALCKRQAQLHSIPSASFPSERGAFAFAHRISPASTHPHSHPARREAYVRRRPALRDKIAGRWAV